MKLSLRLLLLFLLDKLIMLTTTTTNNNFNNKDNNTLAICIRRTDKFWCPTADAKQRVK